MKLLRKNNSIMRYITEQDVLVIHARIIEETGGAHGVRDLNLFISSCTRPRMMFGGKELYQGVYLKASAYIESFAMNHVFIDGNKRISITTSARFLFINGYELTATNKEIENFALRVVVKHLSLKDIAIWLEKHTKKLK